MAKRKSIAFILVLVMVLSVLPTTIGSSQEVQALENNTVVVKTFDQLQSETESATAGTEIIISTSGTIEFTNTIVIPTSVSITCGTTYGAVELIGPSNQRHFIEDNNNDSGVESKFSNLIFKGNETTSTGGISQSGRTVIIDNCTFSGISAPSDGIYKYGAGVLAKNAIISNSQFIGNTAVDNGGGVYASDEATINNSQFIGNTATNGDGGGVYANITIIDSSTLSGNEAKSGGGVYSKRDATIKNSTLTKNTSTTVGGGVYANKAWIICDTIMNNSALLGSELFANAMAHVYYSIVSNSNCSINMAVVSGKNIATSPLPQNNDSLYNAAYSVIGSSTGYTLTDLFGSDSPTLTSNGGPTLTFMPTENAKVVPIEISNSYNPEYLSIDQRGVKRATSGLGYMGSVEIPSNDVTPTPAPTPTTKLANVTKVYSPNKTIYLKKGKSITLPVIATATDSKNPKLTWSSSNKKIATVNQSGKVVAKKKGKAKITVKADNGKSYVFTINVVTKDKKVKKISVKGYKKTMKKKQVKYLKVTLNPKSATNGKITFKSSKKSVLTVDKAGKITAKGKGKAKITVKAGGKKKIISITVK